MITAKELLEQLLKAEKQGFLNVNLSYHVLKKEGLTSIALHIDIDDSSCIAKIIEEDKERILLKHQLQQEQDELKNNKQGIFKNKADRFTYLMIDTRTGKHKIGRSKRPDARERTLQSEVPQIKLIAFCHESVVTEFELHRVFSAKRVRGEWFDLSKKDVLQIKKLMQA